MANLEQRATARNSPLISVYDGRECVGFILPRGKPGFEAFDRNERSVGLFPTRRAAAAAVDSVQR